MKAFDRGETMRVVEVAPAPEVSEGGIGRAVTRLNAEVDTLGDVAERLAAKLQLFLRDAKPESSNNGPRDSSGDASGLANELGMIADRMERVRSVLAAILVRVDL